MSSLMKLRRYQEAPITQPSSAAHPPTARHANPCTALSALTRRVTTLSASSEIAQPYNIYRLIPPIPITQQRDDIIRNMSKASKLTLAGTLSFAIGTVVFVHFQQQAEKNVRLFPPRHSTNLLSRVPG